MKKYEINSKTAAIIGIGKKCSRALEEKREYFINDNSLSIMEHSCEYFGSTYNGRILGSKSMLGTKYKVPIIVEETNDLIFFPTSELENPQCMWISLKWFDRVECENGNTYIYLKNGKKIKTNTSKYSIENQALKSSKLHYLISNRKNL